MKVTLTNEEVKEAKEVAMARQAENVLKGRKPAYGINPQNDLRVHTLGACGELAVAKALDIPWTGARIFRAPDVGQFEVRTTVYQSGHLILHPKDNDNSIFILVIGEENTFELKGWIYGEKGKSRSYWKDKSKKDRPAYFVPQIALRPMRSLPR